MRLQPLDCTTVARVLACGLQWETGSGACGRRIQDGISGEKGSGLTVNALIPGTIVEAVERAYMVSPVVKSVLPPPVDMSP